MISILAVTALLDLAIALVSARGTLSDPTPRRAVAPLLYVKLCTVLPEVAWTALGTNWAFAKSPVAELCPKDMVILAKVATIVGWLLLVGMGVAVYVVFDPIGGHMSPRATAPGGARERHARRIWKMRCVPL